MQSDDGGKVAKNIYQSSLALHTLYSEPSWRNYEKMGDGVESWSFSTSNSSVPVYYEPAQPSGRYTLRGVCPPGETLLVGNRRGYDNTGLILEGLEESLIEADIRALAQSRGLTEVWYPFLTRKLAFDYATRLNTIAVPALVSASFETAGKKHEDFLAHFSKNKRKKIRKERQTAHSSGWSFYWLKSSDVDLQRFCSLLANVEARHGGTPDIRSLERLISSQIECFGDKAQFATCSRDGEIAVQTLVLHEGGKVAARSVGIDYNEAERDSKYFETTYYMPIDLAHEFGAVRVELGPGTLHAKSVRGASLSTRWWVPLKTSKSLKELELMNVSVQDLVADQGLSATELERIDFNTTG